MKVLVTGAAGFIGSHLVEALLRRGDEVIGLDNFNDYYDPRRKQANLNAVRNHPRFAFYHADIRDAAHMERIVAHHRPDVIAHLAAMAGVRYSIGRAGLYTDVNIRGTVNLLEAARVNGVSHFVFASTSSVYGKTEQIPFVESDPCNHPLAPYPASKKAGEIIGHTYWQLHGLHFTALRFFSVYGPRGRPDMMPFSVMHAAVNGTPIRLFDGGRMRRDWTYVEDIIHGVVAALERPLGYAVINLGRGNPVWMSDFVQIIAQLVGREVLVEETPAPPSEPKINYADITKAKQLLGYEPRTTVVDGLTEMWRWYQREIMASTGI
ncbi:MAG: epimerase [Ardenticatenia bacterium]|nr:MAG: epimerase [Ardenticatenia bacterium]